LAANAWQTASPERKALLKSRAILSFFRDTLGYKPKVIFVL